MADNSLEGYSPEDIAAMATEYAKLSSNPQTREIILRAQKTLNLRANIPEIDIADRIKASTADAEKKVEALSLELIQTRAEQRVRDERAKLSKSGYSDDEIAAVEKLMVDEKIPSYETAAKFHKASTQLAVPSQTEPSKSMTNELPGGAMDAMKKGSSALKGWARDQASKAIDDLRSGRVKLQ